MTERTRLTRRTLLSCGIATGTALGLGIVSAARSASASPIVGSSSRLVVDGQDVSNLDEAFLDLLKLGGVDCVHLSHVSQSGIGDFGKTYSFIDRHSDRMTVATSVLDIRRAKQQGRIAAVLGWQDADALAIPLSQAADFGFATMVNHLRAYAQLGLRILGICYNHANMFGSGNVDPRGPLTRAGQRLVQEIHKQRIVLDIGGHTGEQTSFDAIEMSKGVPVVSTHTNMAAINNHQRCISDKLAEAIAGTGGVIGLTAVTDFHIRNRDNARALGEKTVPLELHKHLDQYDYLKKLVGVDHVGLGPDFTAGVDMSVPEVASEESFNWPDEARSAAPPHLWAAYVKGFENISGLPNVIKGLVDRGWTESELDKMLGANWLRVYERVWGA